MDDLLGDYYSPAELAKVLRRSKRTIDRWRWAGEGPPVTRISRRVLYRKDAVREWLKSLETSE